ncbi:MAG: hypothetical protein V1800_15560 [Candidatus Latescibacterota bacterium]
MMTRATWVRVGMGLILLGTIAGCASTGGGERAVPVIPVGKGYLVLDAGGIEELNFSVFNQESGEKADQRYDGLDTYLDPGRYRVEVETDFTYEEFKKVVLDDIIIVEGQENHVRVPVGRFMVNVTQQTDPGSSSSGRAQFPFRVYDFGRKTVLLDRGMTSTQSRHFIAPVGMYKVELTPRVSGESGSYTEHILRPIEIRFGWVEPLMIHLGGSSAQPPQQGE